MNVCGAAAVGNDMFAARTAITGASGASTTTSLSSTFEIGETAVLNVSPRAWASSVGQGSVWYSWTAPSAGIARFTANTVSVDEFGLFLVALYRVGGGGGFNNLQLLSRSFEFGEGWGPIFEMSVSTRVSASDVILVQVMKAVGATMRLTWSLSGERCALDLVQRMDVSVWVWYEFRCC